MKITKAFFAIMFMAAIAFMIAPAVEASVWSVFGVLVASSILIQSKTGVAFMAIQKEIWAKDILGNLFKNNEFAKRAFNADSMVLDGKVVHNQDAGSATVVKKNLTNFPQVAVNRTDTASTYAIDTYYALPRQIQKIESYELSYDKRQSVVGEDQRQLIQEAMEGLLYRWSPTNANVVVTTGAGSADDTLLGATGLRKVFTKAEFKKIAKIIANTNNSGMITALLTANHYHQFFESLSDAEKTNFNNVANLGEGTIGRYMGIDIMMRSSVMRYRKVGGIWTVIDTQDENFAAGAGDSAASLFYIDNCVERAKGDIQVFDDTANPLYYGDVFSALIRLGGRIRRANGVYAVVEDIA